MCAVQMVFSSALIMAPFVLVVVSVQIFGLGLQFGVQVYGFGLGLRFTKLC